MESKKRSRSDDNDDTINIKKKQILENVTSSDSLLPTTSLSDVKEDFRVVIGTYERLLYGINAFWNEQVSAVVAYFGLLN
jgi:protein MAK11